MVSQPRWLAAVFLSVISVRTETRFKKNASSLSSQHRVDQFADPAFELEKLPRCPRRDTLKLLVELRDLLKKLQHLLQAFPCASGASAIPLPTPHRFGNSRYLIRPFRQLKDGRIGRQATAMDGARVGCQASGRIASASTPAGAPLSPGCEADEATSPQTAGVDSIGWYAREAAGPIRVDAVAS